ncbi:hypothetical protein ACFQE8_02205 [Salinirubellus sp. GCM10025818]|jgi:hypothetical protein|uniref:hypothetical protein n=1 Tax=Salinirubellus TaxID=2162630 RepID=UPI0030CC1D20
MDTDRLFNSAVNFGLNFGVAYGVARLLRDHRTGVRAGTAMGALSAAASWILWGRYEDVPDRTETIDGVTVPIEEPSASA